MDRNVSTQVAILASTIKYFSGPGLLLLTLSPLTLGLSLSIECFTSRARHRRTDVLLTVAAAATPTCHRLSLTLPPPPTPPPSPNSSALVACGTAQMTTANAWAKNSEHAVVTATSTSRRSSPCTRDVSRRCTAPSPSFLFPPAPPLLKPLTGEPTPPPPRPKGPLGEASTSEASKKCSVQRTARRTAVSCRPRREAPRSIIENTEFFSPSPGPDSSRGKCLCHRRCCCLPVPTVDSEDVEAPDATPGTASVVVPVLERFLLPARNTTAGTAVDAVVGPKEVRARKKDGAAEVAAAVAVAAFDGLSSLSTATAKRSRARAASRLIWEKLVFSLSSRSDRSSSAREERTRTVQPPPPRPLDSAASLDVAPAPAPAPVSLPPSSTFLPAVSTSLRPQAVREPAAAAFDTESERWEGGAGDDVRTTKRNSSLRITPVSASMAISLVAGGVKEIASLAASAPATGGVVRCVLADGNSVRSPTPASTSVPALPGASTSGAPSNREGRGGSRGSDPAASGATGGASWEPTALSTTRSSITTPLLLRPPLAPWPAYCPDTATMSVAVAAGLASVPAAAAPDGVAALSLVPVSALAGCLARTSIALENASRAVSLVPESSTSVTSPRTTYVRVPGERYKCVFHGKEKSKSRRPPKER